MAIKRKEQLQHLYFGTHPLNQGQLDRWNLVQDVIDRLPQLEDKGAYLKEEMKNKLIEHKIYIRENGIDMPEIINWKWNYNKI